MAVNAFNVCVAVVAVATIVGIVAGMRRASDEATHRPALAAMAVHAVLLCAFLVVILMVRQSWAPVVLAALVVVAPPAAYYGVRMYLARGGEKEEAAADEGTGVAWPKLSDSPQRERSRRSAPGAAPAAEGGDARGDGGADGAGAPVPDATPQPQPVVQVREQRQIHGESARRFAPRRARGESFPAFGSIQAQQPVPVWEKPEPVAADGELLKPEPVVTADVAEPLRPVPVEADDEPLQPVPVEDGDEPLQPVPVEADSEPLHPVPVDEAGDEPLRPVPVENDEPLHPVPVDETDGEALHPVPVDEAEPLHPVPVDEADGEALRPVPVAPDDEPLRPVPVSANEEPMRPVPVEADEGAPRPAPRAPRDPNIPHADDTAADCKVRAFQRARRREREQEEAAEAEARAMAEAAEAEARAMAEAAEAEARTVQETAEAQARTAGEEDVCQPVPVPAHEPGAEPAAALEPVFAPVAQQPEAPTLPTFEPDELFYGEDVDAMLDDDFGLDEEAEPLPVEQTVTVAFDAPDALRYEFPYMEEAGDTPAADAAGDDSAPAAPDTPGADDAPASSPSPAASDADAAPESAVPAALDAPDAPEPAPPFTVELLAPEAPPELPADDEPPARSAEEEALAWEKFESNRKKAQSFRDRGKNLVAAGLFARAADLAPERQQWREMLFEELGCYVRADKMDEARELARLLLRQGTLTRANRIKLNAIISKK